MKEPISLRDHFEAMFREKDLRDQQRFDAQERAVGAAMAAQEKAVTAAMAAADRAVQKAEAAADRRAEGQNEFRATLTDQAATFATKDALDQFRDGLTKDIVALGSRMDRADGNKSGWSAGWQLLMGLAGLGIGVAGAVGMVITLTRTP
jgi:hypothetical protein